MYAVELNLYEQNMFRAKEIITKYHYYNRVCLRRGQR